jgi:hypothetical protein
MIGVCTSTTSPTQRFTTPPMNVIAPSIFGHFSYAHSMLIREGLGVFLRRHRTHRRTYRPRRAALYRGRGKQRASPALARHTLSNPRVNAKHSGDTSKHAYL